MPTLDERLQEIPVSGWLSPEDIEKLRLLDFDVDLFQELPLAGPVTPEQLLALAPRLKEAVTLHHELKLSGPVTAEEMQALAQISPDRLRTTRNAIHGSVEAKELLASVGGDA